MAHLHLSPLVISDTMTWVADRTVRAMLYAAVVVIDTGRGEYVWKLAREGKE